MTPTEALQSHLNLCDELYQLALEENRFLKQNQRVPDPHLLDRKRALLERLDASLTALKQANAASGPRDPERAPLLERAKAKVLQVLHLDKENEQLLLRFSLGVRPPKASLTPASPPPASHLQRLYDRHS